MKIHSSIYNDGKYAIIIAAIIVILFVGNAYIVDNYGGMGIIGDKLVTAGMYLLIPPIIPIYLLSKIGINIPLYGRETFIESNIWLWFYCWLFYATVIYFAIRLFKRIFTGNIQN